MKGKLTFVAIFGILLFLPWLFGSAWEIINPRYFVYIRGSRRGMVAFVVICGVVAYLISRILMKHILRTD